MLNWGEGVLLRVCARASALVNWRKSRQFEKRYRSKNTLRVGLLNYEVCDIKIKPDYNNINNNNHNNNGLMTTTATTKGSAIE